MDTSQYLDIFIDETKEHLQSLNEHILILEKEPENEETINEIFRAAHSLKGMAGTMGFKNMQRLAHDLENAFQEVRNGNVKADSKLVDILFRGIDALEQYLECIQSDGNEGTEDNQDIIDDLNALLREGGVGPDEPVVKKAETHATVSEDDKKKFKRIPISEYEMSAIEEAKNEGEKIFGVTVYLQETCILKAARAFLVFKNIEKKGELIKSVPTVEEIEDEEFEFDFSWVLASESNAEEIKQCIEKVSEIAEVYVEEFDVGGANNAKKEVEGTSASTSENAPTAPVAAPVGEQRQEAAKKPKAAKVVASRSVRVDIEKLDVLMNLVSELIIAKNGLVSSSETEKGSQEDNKAFNEQIEYLERVTTSLHESVMKTRMVPIETVVNRFPRMIRDLSRKLDKKMELYMTGEDTELDRTVIDEIGDPLMHLLRNSADHGLESSDVRLSLGKPEVGSIFLDAYQQGNNVIISVGDDGGGINVEKVKAKALSSGAITEEQASTMTDQEAIDLLFRPSFSTAEKVSDISGRGVGLDVVKTKIESLGGNILATTELGKGSTFTIQLPLTLAIIQALMVQVGEEKYAIPLGNIDTIEDITPGDIKFVQSKEVVNLRGGVVPLIRLSELLDVEVELEKTVEELEEEGMLLVVVRKGDQRAGLVIDRLIGQQETVIKSLGKHIANQKLFSGATILGDGEVALILDPNSLI